METDRIRLIPPSMEIVPEVTEAIRESAPELSEYLGWVEASLADPEANVREAGRAGPERERRRQGDVKNVGFMLP